jgi:hypothetical protein
MRREECIMEENQTGTVEFLGMKPARSLFRFVERQVEKWIERERSLLFLPRVAHYNVQVEKTAEHPLYQCAMRITIGSREWRSTPYSPPQVRPNSPIQNFVA